MAFPDPENYSLAGEVTNSFTYTYSKTATALDTYIPYSLIAFPSEYSLEGSIVQRLYTSTPDTGGGSGDGGGSGALCEDPRPDTGMLYPRG